jgi:hypothetical protein
MVAALGVSTKNAELLQHFAMFWWGESSRHEP